MNSNKQLVLLFVVFTLCLIAADSAFASNSGGGGGGLPYEAGLEKIKNSMTGPVASTVSLTGVVAAGATLIFGGELNAFLRTIIFLVLVVSLVVGANNIIDLATGSGAII